MLSFNVRKSILNISKASQTITQQAYRRLCKLLFGLRLICTENDRETRTKRKKGGGGGAGLITEGPRIY